MGFEPPKMKQELRKSILVPELFVFGGEKGAKMGPGGVKMGMGGVKMGI